MLQPILPLRVSRMLSPATLLLVLGLLLPMHAGAEEQVLLTTRDDCVTATNGVIENSDPAIPLPHDRAILRIGYWGDPGTHEREQSIGRTVQWNLGLATGIQSAPAQQLGYYDLGMPIATSGIQANCSEVGVVINTFEFNHTEAVLGGGPFASYGEKLSLPAPIFPSSNRAAQRMLVRGEFKHPYHRWTEPGSTGQINLVYYLQPLWCPELYPGRLCPAVELNNRVPTFAHVIAVFDNRPAVADAPLELSLHDGFHFFVSSALSPGTELAPVAFVTPSARSATYVRGNSTWSDWRLFEAELSRAQLQKLLNVYRDSAAPCPRFDLDDPACLIRVSPPDIADWGIVHVAALVESNPGAHALCIRGQNAAGCRNIALGVGMRNIEAVASFELPRLISRK